MFLRMDSLLNLSDSGYSSLVWGLLRPLLILLPSWALFFLLALQLCCTGWYYIIFTSSFLYLFSHHFFLYLVRFLFSSVGSYPFYSHAHLYDMICLFLIKKRGNFSCLITAHGQPCKRILKHHLLSQFFHQYRHMLLSEKWIKNVIWGKKRTCIIKYTICSHLFEGSVSLLPSNSIA